MNKHKVNTNLVIRMYFDHNYSIEDICLRLRYPYDLVKTIVERHSMKNDAARNN